MTQLKSESHQIVVNRVNKIAVSSYDDKRYLLEDGVRSLAYGHYSLRKFDENGEFISDRLLFLKCFLFKLFIFVTGPSRWSVYQSDSEQSVSSLSSSNESSSTSSTESDDANEPVTAVYPVLHSLLESADSFSKIFTCRFYFQTKKCGNKKSFVLEVLRILVFISRRKGSNYRLWTGMTLTKCWQHKRNVMPNHQLVPLLTTRPSKPVVVTEYCNSQEQTRSLETPSVL